MWPFLKLKKLIVVAPDLVIEICLRLVLLAGVCLIRFWIQPYERSVSEEQFTRHYKNPRRDSISTPIATVCVVIIIPLSAFTISFLSTRNHAEFCQAFLAWTLALTVNGLITETVKLMTGRLRPDFFYRCFPDGLITSGLEYTGDARDVNEGRKSFPSGHSSFAFCSMGFVSIWMRGRVEVSRRRWPVRDVMYCLTPLLISTLVAISRVYDNHHYWSDVVAGSLIGFFISYACYAYYYNLMDESVSGSTDNLAYPECRIPSTNDTCLVHHSS